jgi:ribonuclease HII
MTADDLLIVGVDEAGRGPLAGPVFAAAVVLDPERPIVGLRDSKKLSPKRREALAELIRERALAWAVAQASAEEIDQVNILQATLLAMQRAIDELATLSQVSAVRARVDGQYVPALPEGWTGEAIIGGDDSDAAISAASILAKVARDQLMDRFEERYPGYGFGQHKGYGTATHLTALRNLGPCQEHRRSFAPVRNALR